MWDPTISFTRIAAHSTSLTRSAPSVPFSEHPPLLLLLLWQEKTFVLIIIIIMFCVVKISSSVIGHRRIWQGRYDSDTVTRVPHKRILTNKQTNKDSSMTDEPKTQILRPLYHSQLKRYNDIDSLCCQPGPEPQASHGQAWTGPARLSC